MRDTISHPKIREYFKKALSNNAHAQSYIFYGHADSGLYEFSNEIIQTLFCSNNDSIRLGDDFCRECAHCHHFLKGSHPDFMEIDLLFDEKTKKFKKNISIEQIRSVQGRLAQKPFMNSYTIVRINQAHTLSLQAANSLLKAIEEPNSKTVFFFISNQLEALPDTIISRSVNIEFLPTPQHMLREYVKNIILKNIDLDDVVRLSHNQPLRLKKLVDDGEYLAQYIKASREFIESINSSINTRFDYINTIANKKNKESLSSKELLELINSWKEIMRDSILIKCDCTHLIKHRILEQELQKIAADYTIDNLIMFIKNCTKVQEMIEHTINPQLALENLFLSLQRSSVTC